MDFFKDRVLLKQLIRQGDLMNTMNGGVTAITFESFRTFYGWYYLFKCPSFDEQSVRMVVKDNKLTVYSILTDFDVNEPDSLIHMPIGMRTVKIPDHINAHKISSHFGAGALQLFLPYYETY